MSIWCRSVRESVSFHIKRLRWLQRRGSPLTIPNRVVKPFSADGTAVRWESRSLPFFFFLFRKKGNNKLVIYLTGFFCLYLLDYLPITFIYYFFFSFLTFLSCTSTKSLLSKNPYSFIRILSQKAIHKA